jgi:hypothetical protein
MKTYIVDIDNTICHTNNSDYENSIPLYSRIEKINALYNSGNTVIYWTARGGNSGKDWKELTINQLNSWGCLRNDIMFNKPSYDIFIDDKSINANNFF